MSEIINKSLTPPDVSRETMDQFKIYFSELVRWNRTISLMKDLEDFEQFYSRHICDALDIYPYLENTVFDLGSGGGVPGIVIGILRKKVILIESNTKKATFLNSMIKMLDLDCECINDRLENIEFYTSITLTARAVTDLTKLISYQYNVSRETKGIYLKGEKIFKELEEAQKEWLFDYKIHDRMNNKGYIIQIENVEKR